MKRFTIVTLLAACAGLGMAGCKSPGGAGATETGVSGSASGSMTSGSTGAAGANPTSGTTGGTAPAAGPVQGASAATNAGDRR